MVRMSDEADAVLVEQHGPVTVVTLRRPQVRNAVDAATAHGLHEAFLAFDDDAEARVAVFHGAGGHFCAGWDLQHGARVAQQGGGAALLEGLDFDPAETRAPGPTGGP